MRKQLTSVVAAFLLCATGNAAESIDAQATSAKVDQLLNQAFQAAKVKVAPVTSDDDFIRRVTLDLIGRFPSSREVRQFRSSVSSEKRAELIERLLKSDSYARNWAAYWRNVIMSRATDQRARLARRSLESWLTARFKENAGWDKIATRLVTGTGDVRVKGEAGFIFAHGADAKEVAAETSRIFMGIQIQCANCHDHPTDKWNRKQFHQLAAFFPRMRVVAVRNPQLNRIQSFEVISSESRRRGYQVDPRRFIRDYDKDRDGSISKKDVEGLRLERFVSFMVRRFDRNKDGKLSKEELETMTRRSNRYGRDRGREYYVAGLTKNNRRSRVDPVFFASEQEIERGLKDIDRRGTLAKLMTSPDNKWFAQAFVNRIWSEMLGEGFYMPIDDMGPQRNARFPKVLALLSESFTKSGYDVKLLYRTIANTEAYQRQIQARDPAKPGLPFAAAQPTRLRSDQIYNAVRQALGVSRLQRGRFRFGSSRRERSLFSQMFSFDPSTPQSDIVGNVPQALFMMNNRSLNSHINGRGYTRLAKILRQTKQDKEALRQVYLMVHSREPSKKELGICTKYIAKVDDRTEAFEDILWTLLNSSEFLTKR